MDINRSLEEVMIPALMDDLEGFKTAREVWLQMWWNSERTVVTDLRCGRAAAAADKGSHRRSCFLWVS